MEPIKTISTNSIYRLAGCEDLPATRGEMQTQAGPIPIVETTWQLNEEEREEFLRTGLIRVRFIGTSIIPMWVSPFGAFQDFEERLQSDPEFLKNYREHFGIPEEIIKE